MNSSIQCKDVILFGTGYISNHLRETLCKQGFNIHLLRFRYSKTDINKLLNVEKKYSIIMLGGITRHIENSHLSTYKTVKIYIDTLESFKILSLSSIIFLSTVDVYGINNNKKILDEHSKINPEDNYSTGKIICEKLIENFANQLGIPYLIARLTGIYGNDTNSLSAVSKIYKSALETGYIIKNFKGSIYRDYLYINNLTDAIIYYLNNPINLGVVNFASGIKVSLVDLIKFISKITNAKIIISKEIIDLNRSKSQLFDNSLFKKYFPTIKLKSYKQVIK